MRSILAILCTVVAPAAFAVPVTYNFTGLITTGVVSGIFAGQGNAVSGTFSFDDGLVDSQGGGFFDAFRNDIPVANQPLTSGFAASLTVGGVTVSDTSSLSTTLEGLLFIKDHPGSDDIRYTLQRQTGQQSFFNLEARDFAAVPDGVAVGSGNLTGSIGGAISILDNLNLSLFDTFNIPFSEWSESNSSGRIGFVQFEWTGISRVTSVPEPSTLGLLGAGLLGLFMRRKRGDHKF